MVQQAQDALGQLASDAGQAATVAPDLSGQVQRQVAAGTGLAAATQEAEQAPQDEAQLALVEEQKQKTDEVRQQAAQAQQALKQQNLL